jgi:hypothetical protein
MMLLPVRSKDRQDGGQYTNFGDGLKGRDVEVISPEKEHFTPGVFQAIPGGYLIVIVIILS